jgi:hypothetical protein
MKKNVKRNDSNQQLPNQLAYKQVQYETVETEAGLQDPK